MASSIIYWLRLKASSLTTISGAEDRLHQSAIRSLRSGHVRSRTLNTGWQPFAAYPRAGSPSTSPAGPSADGGRQIPAAYDDAEGCVC